MPLTIEWAKRKFREKPDDPQKLLERPKTFADSTFLDACFLPWLVELIFVDPQAGLHWARVVPDLALVTPEEPTPDGRREHRSRIVKARNILGSAFRACSRHAESDREYAEARKLIASESIDPVISAETDRNLAYLRACQGRTQEALELATRAVEALRDKGNSNRIAHALLCRGYVFTHVGRFSDALALFGEALATAGKPTRRPADMRLHTALCMNLARAICDSRADDKARALSYIRQAKAHVKGGWRFLPRYRLLWVEGVCWSSMGYDSKAERDFLLAKEGFEALKLPYEAGVTSLDLGEIYRLHGEWEKLEPLARDAYALFERLGTTTTALRTMLQWRDAAVARTLTAEITATARRLVERKIGPGGCCKTRQRGPT